VYVEQGSAIARELYLAITLDRAAEKLAIIASTEGGMSIEEVAEATPEKIITVHVDPNLGLQDHHVRPRRLRLGLARSRSSSSARSCAACSGCSSRRTRRSPRSTRSS
jgi:succinyl-CoA synthetase beta subunit